MKEPEFVTVFHSQGMLQAQVIRGKLESAGVPVYLKYESVGQIFGLTVDGLGLVQVQVPTDWEETAVALLTDDDATADPREIAEQTGDDGGPDELD